MKSMRSKKPLNYAYYDTSLGSWFFYTETTKEKHIFLGKTIRHSIVLSEIQVLNT